MPTPKSSIGPKGGGSGEGGGEPSAWARFRARRFGQVATAAASAADMAVRAMPFIMALRQLHQALAIVDNFEAHLLALEAADHAGHDLGLDALPTPADLRHRHFLDLTQARIDEELAWLRENGQGVLRAALSIAAPGSKLTGKVSDDLTSFRLIQDDIEDRVDHLNELNIVCGVYIEKLAIILREVQTRSTALAKFMHSNWMLMKKSANFPALELELLSIENTSTQVSHHLGVFESALERHIEGYQTERTKARNEWLTLVRLWNVWRPRYLEIARQQGFDISGNRQSIPIDSLSDQTTPTQVPPMSSATSPEQPDPVHASE